MYGKGSMNTEIKNVLSALRAGEISEEEALLRIKTEPFRDIGYAKIDLHRKARQGVSEVIYGAGKSVEQIIGIIETMCGSGQESCLCRPHKVQEASDHQQHSPGSQDEASLP